MVGRRWIVVNRQIGFFGQRTFLVGLAFLVVFMDFGQGKVSGALSQV